MCDGVDVGRGRAAHAVQQRADLEAVDQSARSPESNSAAPPKVVMLFVVRRAHEPSWIGELTGVAVTVLLLPV